ncbi:aminoglycoside phosphotransferase family protein [Bacillus sp. D386]|uniref:aminoglycoside phosphotransferase family protein n=1 Tax=Bacillus sp. D386 TaxID=2587155 RepID=UPI0011237E90|nr:aminoglycoside phosphotransferase family protein [Bacillus sp. D386]
MELAAPFAMGNTANIYLWDNKIIKVFKEYLPATEARYEANKQKLVFSLGLSVPEIVDVTVIDGKQAIIMEYIKGRTFGSIVSENMSKAEYYMSMSIDIQQEIHSVIADSLELMTDKLIRQIEQAAVLKRKHKDILIQKMNEMSYDKRLCHGDFHLFNLIDSDNKVTIIDWVDSSVGDIRADVCRTYLLYSEVSMELAEMYLHLYCVRSGLSEKEVLQWIPIIAGARLAEHVSKGKSKHLLEIVHQQCPL